MTETTYEVAQIRQITREVGRFGGIMRLLFVAEKTGPDGTETIAMSSEYEWQKDKRLPEGELEDMSRHLHNVVLQSLLTDGWEPVGTDERGRIMALRRAIGADQPEKRTRSRFLWNFTHPWRREQKPPPS
jgi:hypothetical protein